MTRWIPSLASLLLLSWSAPAAAQTHPCDTAPPPAQTVASGAPLKMRWCQPATDLIEAAIIVTDGVPVDLVPVTALSGPNAAGLVFYETPTFLQVSRGTHTLVVSCYNRDPFTGMLQVGLPSAPFTFAAVDAMPVPAAPIVYGVSR